MSDSQVLIVTLVGILVGLGVGAGIAFSSKPSVVTETPPPDSSTPDSGEQPETLSATEKLEKTARSFLWCWYEKDWDKAMTFYSDQYLYRMNESYSAASEETLKGLGYANKKQVMELPAEELLKIYCQRIIARFRNSEVMEKREKPHWPESESEVYAKVDSVDKESDLTIVKMSYFRDGRQTWDSHWILERDEWKLAWSKRP